MEVERHLTQPQEMPSSSVEIGKGLWTVLLDGLLGMQVKCICLCLFMKPVKSAHEQSRDLARSFFIMGIKHLIKCSG